MNGQTVTFLVLVSNQIVGALAFLIVYGREPGWWRTPLGRHLMFWPTASAVVDLTWLLAVTLRWAWLVYLLLVAMAVVGLLTWQRVWLAWKAQRRG